MLVEEVISHLKAHEERIRDYDSREEEKHLLLTHGESLTQTKKKDMVDSSFSSTKERGSHNKENKGHGRGHDCGRKCGSRGGHENASQTHDDPNPWKDKSMIKCYSYERYRHYAMKCFNKKRNEEANLTFMHEAEKMFNLLMLNEEKAMVNLLTDGENRKETSMWYLDNGASNHSTGDRAKFKELDEKLIGNMKLGDGSILSIQDKGSILFQCKNNDQRLLTKVY